MNKWNLIIRYSSLISFHLQLITPPHSLSSELTSTRYAALPVKVFHNGKSKRLLLVVQVLQVKFAVDCRLYGEFLDDVKVAIAAEGGYPVWAEQIEPLLPNPAAEIAHECFIFLLRRMRTGCAKKVRS